MLQIAGQKTVDAVSDSFAPHRDATASKFRKNGFMCFGIGVSQLAVAFEKGGHMGRIRVRHGEHEIEIEGDDQFVSGRLAEFYAKIGVITSDSASDKKPPSRRGKDHQVSEALEKQGAASNAKVEKPNKRGAKRGSKVKNITPERFDTHKTKDAPSLEDYFNEKNPGTGVGNRIAVIADYIIRIKGNKDFSEGQIEYAYRQLGLKGRPAHMRQIIINNKNQRDLFDLAPDGIRWVLTRTGEIFVDEKLPSSS